MRVPASTAIKLHAAACAGGAVVRLRLGAAGRRAYAAAEADPPGATRTSAGGDHRPDAERARAWLSSRSSWLSIRARHSIAGGQVSAAVILGDIIVQSAVFAGFGRSNEASPGTTAGRGRQALMDVACLCGCRFACAGTSVWHGLSDPPHLNRRDRTSEHSWSTRIGATAGDGAGHRPSRDDCLHAGRSRRSGGRGIGKATGRVSIDRLVVL
jgi:hypothetical protein